jgi:hypothetical protein
MREGLIGLRFWRIAFLVVPDLPPPQTLTSPANPIERGDVRGAKKQWLTSFQFF